MSDALSVRLSYPPSANRLWRYTGGKALKSAEYRSWLDIAVWEARTGCKGMIDGPYALHVVASRPDKRKRDIDNLLKPISDACAAAGLVTNDSDCQRISAEWSSEGEGVRVTITRAERA